MDTTVFLLLSVIEALVIGGFFLLYPRIARRGLLFGVYVGEDRWNGEEARRIVRSWQTGIVVWTIATVAITVGLFARSHDPVWVPVSTFALPGGCLAMFLRAYFRARPLGIAGQPQAVALLEVSEAPSRLPLLATAIGAIGGIIAITYAAMHYAELPGRVPTHFGASGLPDQWRPKSFWSVMMLPFVVLVMGIGLGGMSFFIARAKRAVRFPHTRISAEAQRRFRMGVMRLMCMLALMTTFLLTTLAIGSIRVGLGQAAGLPPAMTVLGIGLVMVAVGGTLFIIIRYGQGGSRLEREAAGAPLTDGLADNRHWILGSFYVNREDPSIFVERRFGFGYTINFGNWRAVALLVAFLGTLLLLALAGALKH